MTSKNSHNVPESDDWIMFRLPWHLLRRRQRTLKLRHWMISTLLSSIEPSDRIRLRRVIQQVLDVEMGITDVVVGGEFVPVKDRELDLERRFVPSNVEQQLLVPDGRPRVTDDASAEDFLAEGDDDERVHIPSSSRHCSIHQHRNPAYTSTT